MKIAIGADHAGFALKQKVADALRAEGHEVVDLGAASLEPADDYPDFAAAVARNVASGDSERGILVCDTGTGMVMAANKVNGIRAALAVNPEEVGRSRQHNNANVLSLSAKYTDAAKADEYIKIFLDTPFEDGGRHERRVHKIAQMERK